MHQFQCLVTWHFGTPYRQGYLQTDGYSAYNKVNAKHLGCWAHERRKFIEAEAEKVQGKHKTGKITIVLNYIGKLYGIEKSIVGLSRCRNQRYVYFITHLQIQMMGVN